MAKILKLWSIWQYIEAALLITLGVLTIVYAGDSGFWNIIGYCAGALIILDASMRLCVQFAKSVSSNDKSGLLAPIAELTFGVFICFIPQTLVQYFSLLLAIMLIILSLIIIAEGVVRIVKKDTNIWLLIAYFVTALLLLTLGILGLVYFNYAILTILIIVGVVLALGGIAEIVTTTMVLVKQHKAKKEAE